MRSGAWREGLTRRTFTADQVVLAAGTWGTQQLLHRMKAVGVLPGISDRLGVLTRTNSEALGGATTKWRNRNSKDFTRGVAITSSIHPDELTHIEPVRYGKGSNAMGLLSTIATKGGGRFPRWVTWLGQAARHPGQALSLYGGLNRWSERTIIGLVMQTHDNSLTTFTKRTRLGRLKVTSKQGHGLPNPTWIPAAHEALTRVAEHIDGFPGNSIGEIFDVPMTAHFLGGCAIGDSPATGVVDPYHRMYGHAGLHVVDGSAISANIGVNPSLTITAQAERALALWPNKGSTTAGPRWMRLTSASTRCRRCARSCPSTHRRPCDCRSSPCAEPGPRYLDAGGCGRCKSTRTCSSAAAGRVDDPAQRTEGRCPGAVVDVGSPARAGDQARLAQLLEVVAHGGLGQAQRRSEIAGAQAGVGRGQQPAHELHAHRVGQGLQAQGDGQCVLGAHDASRQWRTADRCGGVDSRQGLRHDRMLPRSSRNV